MIYLGKEKVKSEDGITDFKFELINEKYGITYVEDDSSFYFRDGVYLLGKCNSKIKAKKGLIQYLKKYQPQQLANINEKWIA